MGPEYLVVLAMVGTFLVVVVSYYAGRSSRGETAEVEATLFEAHIEGLTSQLQELQLDQESGREAAGKLIQEHRRQAVARRGATPRERIRMLSGLSPHPEPETPPPDRGA